MQITHNEARTWIQLNADAALNASQKQMLASHLATCVECRNYADSIQNMEAVLRPMLQRQWKQQPVSLPVGMLVSRGASRSVAAMMLATRMAAIGVMFIAFMFSALQFTLFRPSAPSPALANVPSMPIPSTSTQLINTQTTCGTTVYVVGKNDTLAAIAYQFSIPVEEIIQANALTNNTMITGQELIIPACTSTPTSTLDPVISTQTPVLGRITSTPGG